LIYNNIGNIATFNDAYLKSNLNMKIYRENNFEYIYILIPKSNENLSFQITIGIDESINIWWVYFFMGLISLSCCITLLFLMISGIIVIIASQNLNKNIQF
jgi:hypothetical protein